MVVLLGIKFYKLNQYYKYNQFYIFIKFTVFYVFTVVNTVFKVFLFFSVFRVNQNNIFNQSFLLFAITKLITFYADTINTKLKEFTVFYCESVIGLLIVVAIYSYVEI